MLSAYSLHYIGPNIQYYTTYLNSEVQFKNSDVWRPHTHKKKKQTTFRRQLPHTPHIFAFNAKVTTKSEGKQKDSVKYLK